MSVCEGVVGSSLQALFDSLDSPELVNFARQCRVEADLIEGMEKQVSKLLPVISRAEANQFKSDPVRKWLEELKDIVYEAEDILDLFQTKSLCCKLKQSDSPSPSHIDSASPLQVWDLEELKDVVYEAEDVLDLFQTKSLRCKLKQSDSPSPSRTDCASPLQGLLDPSTSSVTSLNDKIKHVNKRLEAIVRRKKALGLKKGIPGTCAEESSEPRLETSPLVNEPRIYGRDRDVDKLIKLLLSVEPCNANVGVIPIVGQGGIGKTTFAQQLYNHIAVKKHFNLRVWVCVSHVFDMIRATKGIIESASGKPCDLTQLPAIHEALKKMLAGRKFLIVLDDVWMEEYKDWIALSTPFEAGAKGSKVIITTRSEKVCSITGTVSPHRLDLLSEDDSFSLFKRHAFQNPNTQARASFEGIGKEIVRKCKGLPLAVRALGGILRSKQGEADWEDILNNEVWDLLDQETELGPALWLSYYHLPAHLKMCFAYCGIFHKDHEFDKEELIRLWMAQGFLQQKENPKIKKRMEDIGERYFCELVSRSFFQQSNEYKPMFVMHDLISDLARAALGETCFMLSDEGHSMGKQISEKTRHFSCRKLSFWTHGYSKIFKALYGATKLRTFIHLSSDEVPCDLLPRLVCLRVLDLGTCSDIFELPESISNLVQLRYLNLSDTLITRLPESINSLCNLQTLLLRRCNLLTKLPSNMGSLINLRYFDINKSSVEKMSRGMGRLKELQMLPFFIVDENNEIGMEELTTLEHLRGTLEISGLENVRDPINKKINLRNKPYLETLRLTWNYHRVRRPHANLKGLKWNDRHTKVNDSWVESVVELVLDQLQPHANLKRLYVADYYGTSFPSWLGDPLCCSNLVKIALQDCICCKSLPSFAQLPLLEELSISGMFEWKEWIGVGQESEQEFPRLRDLCLELCPRLQIVPHCFPALVKLYISDCKRLTSFSRYRLLGCNEVVVGGLQHPKEIELPSMLESIKIVRCNYLKLLLEEFFRHTSLEELEIVGCSFPNSFSKRDSGCSSSTATIDISKLKRIKIDSIQGLTSLPDELHRLSCLETLVIKDCPRLLSFPQGGLPSTKLRCLKIKGCEGLQSLEKHLHRLSCLETLVIKDCPRLLSFPQGGLPSTKLRCLKIKGCEGLQSLANQLHSLTSLRKLHIKDCPSLMSSPEGCFPSNLESLTVYIDCNSFLPSSAWGFHFGSLTSLRELQIIGCEGIESFPEWLLPTTLTTLDIQSFPNLKTLPGLQQHTSLRILLIFNCPELTSLPEQGLPTTHCKLITVGCPLLIEWYQKKKREHSPTLAKITLVRLSQGLKNQASPSWFDKDLLSSYNFSQLQKVLQSPTPII